MKVCKTGWKAGAMNNKVLNKLIRDQMQFGRLYSHAAIYQIYLDDVIKNDAFFKEKVLHKKTIKNYVNSWAVDSVWLGRKYTDKGVAAFYKIEPPVNCPYLLIKLKLKEAIAKLWTR